MVVSFTAIDKSFVELYGKERGLQKRSISYLL